MFGHGPRDPVITIQQHLTPNYPATVQSRTVVRAMWLFAAAGLWTLLHPPVLPDIWDVLLRLPGLFGEVGLGAAIMASMRVNIEAIVLSSLIALPLAWATRIPLLAPLGRGLSQLRFLSPASFYIVLLLVLGGGHAVKLWMLVLAQSFYLVTTMTNVVENIPAEAFDEAKVLRMTDWQAMWYIVVRGTLADALEAIRDNAAIGWSMLMMVEGIIRSEGGMGVLIYNMQERRMDYEAGFAIAVAIGIIGFVQDWALREARSELCPYTKLS